jgi:hypothetical protein
MKPLELEKGAKLNKGRIYKIIMPAKRCWGVFHE